MGRLSTRGVLHAERPREVGGSSCLLVHGQGHRYQANGTDRVHQLHTVADVSGNSSGKSAGVANTLRTLLFTGVKFSLEIVPVNIFQHFQTNRMLLNR